MTIIYQYRVATTSLGGFLKLLRAWKGSVYKLMYKELLIFLSLYACVSVVYRVGLAPGHKRMFESLVLELHSATAAIPLSFVLGFYVTIIVQRWWQQFTNVPWPDRTLFIMCTYLQGTDERARIMRRTVARYMLFGMILICRSVSVAVMKRFPTIDHIVEAGFITKDEAAAYEIVQCQYLKFWVPLMWANNVLVTARREGKIQTDFGLRMAIQQLADFRDKCSLCFVYDWITVPLVYTQVVTFAVYSYFAVSLVGQQYLDSGQNYEGYEHDWFVPGFTILQFLFYMGWLKVAEQMINPFGEDDDDYDINWLLDRHTAVAFALVDQCSGIHPPLLRDSFWNDIAPDVPYTESSLGSVRPNFLGSTFNVARPSIDVERLIHEDELPAIWNGRPRAKSGSVSGSLLSLLPFRNLRSHVDNTDAQSAGSQQQQYQGARFLPVPQGKQLYHPFNTQGQGRGNSQIGSGTTGEEERRLSDHTPYRSKTLTEYDSQEANERQRKLSLPFNVHLASLNRQRTLEISPTGSPKLSRFKVEPVPEEVTTDSDQGQSKTRRPGHNNVSFQNGGVSRVPILSSIEEGHSVTSMAQMMAQRKASVRDGMEEGDEEVFKERTGEGEGGTGQDGLVDDMDAGGDKVLKDTTLNHQVEQVTSPPREQSESRQATTEDGHFHSMSSPLLKSAEEEEDVTSDRKTKSGSRRRKGVAHISLDNK